MKLYESLKPNANSKLSNLTNKKGLMAITDRTNIPKITVSSNKYGTSFNDVNKEMPNI